MTYQLRRMILVNAGTNTGRPSGRVTEIDSRGGAAVIGANGVGKTSTLRLIPLFFGHPTSEAVAVNQGQEGVKFILPTHTSAICFEYQRGSDAPENLRLAVMRPRTDADAPEYRIYPCAFDRDMFIREGRFLNDEDSTAIALAKGAVPTSKLSTPQYRAVILGSRVFSKDQKKILAYARNNSFGPRELPNLDKLVATVVKEKVNFQDLVQVAVGLVLAERGGELRQKVTFRQQRKQIEEWLSNRDAAQAAQAAQTRITTLNELVQNHTTLQQEWRNRHFEVLELTKHWGGQREQAEASLATMSDARKLQEQTDRQQEAGLADSAEVTEQLAASADSSHKAALNEQNYFAEADAEGWATRIQLVPSLNTDLSGLKIQRDLATAKVQEAEHQYKEREQALDREVGAKVLDEEMSKEQHHARYNAEHDEILACKDRELQDAAARIEGQREELDARLDPLKEQSGALKARIASPEIDPALRAALEEARAKEQRHGEEAIKLSRRLLEAQEHFGQSTTRFADAERKLNARRLATAAARNGLASVQERLNPADGTLMSALRQQSDQQWKHDLARVLNPELLTRTDLEPTALPDAQEGACYGWHIQTAHIDAPAWTDDEQLRLAEHAAQADLMAAGTGEREAADELEAASTERREADNQLNQLRSRDGVHHAQAKVLRVATETQEGLLQEALKTSAAASTEAHDRLLIEIAELKAQLTGLTALLGATHSAIHQEYAKLLAEATGRRDSALAGIDRSINRLKADALQRREEYAAQLNEHLQKAGVSQEKLAQLDKHIAEVSEQLREIEENRPLVARWRKWLEEAGPLKVVDFASQARETKAAHERALNDLRLHQTAADERAKSYRAEVEEVQKRLATATAELAIMTALPQLFTDYAPSPHEAISLQQSARDVRRVVEKEAQALQRSETAITNLTSDLIRELTARESTTKQLFEGHVTQAREGVLARATAVTSAFRRLGPQVIHELNNTLRAVLADIGSFHKTILTFESEVGTFNSTLQEALKDVKRFNRVDDLHLNIVADFSELDFYKKLKNMESLVRQHRGEVGVDLYSDMPPVGTAEVLRDFLGVIRDGSLEVDLGAHISLSGSVMENGRRKAFKRASELQGVSSTGLTSLILITLLVGLVNTVRRGDDVHVPWVTDEVGAFDAGNFEALLRMLADNKIDVLTASPALDMNQFAFFSNRYVFEDQGVVRRFVDTPEEVAA